MSQYLREILNEIPPYIPGRSIESIQKQYGISKVYKLASNENPYGPSPKALKAVKLCLKDLNRYPDPDAANLKNKLAVKLGIIPENILVGNGAAEIIDLIAMAFINRGDEVILSYPTFPKYYLSCRRVEGKIKQIKMKNFHHDCRDILNQITPKTKNVFIDTPCNPVGSKLSLKELEMLLKEVPDHVILVLDEAYRDFIDETECLNYGNVVSQKKNVLFLRTFSKGFGLSGLRVGYAVGDVELIQDINRVREVFNANSLALIAAEAALDDSEYLKKTVAQNEKGKKYLTRHLKKLRYEFQPTYTNFILIDTRRDLKAVDDFLLSKGIIVRPIKIRDMSGSYMRVSIGKMNENKAFISAMEEMKERIPEKEN